MNKSLYWLSLDDLHQMYKGLFSKREIFLERGL